MPPNDDRVDGTTSWGTVFVLLLVLGGIAFLILHHVQEVGAQTPPTVTTSWSDGAGLQSKSAPVRIQIPRLGVNAPVIRLGLNADGTLQVPTVYSQTGWWAGGKAPGQKGPAVIVGHVDNANGPAVFYRLKDLRPGDLIEVTRADGKTARFQVLKSEQVPKSGFPTRAVYGPVGYPALRLVTCTGAFDHSTGHYVDNLIVFARLVS